MALRLRGSRLCCAGSLWIPKLCFPTQLLAAESSAGEAPYPPPRPSTPPSLSSTIHLRLPRARNVPQDTVGLVPNPFWLISPGLLQTGLHPVAAVWVLVLKEQTEAPPPHNSSCFTLPQRHGGGCTMEGQGTPGWGQGPPDPSFTAQTPSTMVMSDYVRPRLQTIHPFSWPFCSHHSRPGDSVGSC